MIVADALKHPAIAHGFFTRAGGVSTGIFSSLNCGLGSGDDVALVTENRGRVAAQLSVKPDHLVSAYQVHGIDIAVVEGPLADRPRADGLVSRVPGIALGVLTADCGPVLFADVQAGVIGACHAGWKGALLGVTDATVLAMEKLGASPQNITAVLGPTISQANYEVGPEFLETFLKNTESNRNHFNPSVKPSHYHFDLPQFLVDRMLAFGIGTVIDLGLCTYADEARFFSYRRNTHQQIKDYGRLISAIALRS